MQKKALVVETGLKVNLYGVGDVHVLSKACDEKRNEELAGIIAQDKYARVIGLGDYTESIAPSDKRWSSRELAEPSSPEMLENLFYRQAMRFCKLYEPTKGKWDALVRGNHEQTAIDKYFIDPCAIIAERMGAAYIGNHEHCGWIVYLMKSDDGKTRGTVKVFFAHGWGGGVLKGGVALKMQRTLMRKDADVVLLAHTHQPMAFPETVECLTQRYKLSTETRWGVVTFPMITKHGYMARRGGNESPVGYSVVRLKATTNNDRYISVEQKSM